LKFHDTVDDEIVGHALKVAVAIELPKTSCAQLIVPAGVTITSLEMSRKIRAFTWAKHQAVWPETHRPVAIGRPVVDLERDQRQAQRYFILAPL
jgi:hypothetical protein